MNFIKRAIQSTIKIEYYFARNIKVKNQLQLEKKKEEIQTKPNSEIFSSDDDEDEDDISKVQLTKKLVQYDEKKAEEKIKEIQQTVLYEGDDPYYEKLVERPQKGMVWGLSGKLVQQSKSLFSANDKHDSIIKFLEINQIKDITFTDLHEFQKFSTFRYGIVGTMYSTIHGWKVCKELIKGLKVIHDEEVQQKMLDEQRYMMKVKLLDADQIGAKNRERYSNKFYGQGGKPMLYGAKDDEWLMVGYKDFMVHLFNEDTRKEYDIEGKWKYMPTEEEQEEYRKMTQSLKNKKGGFFEPLKK